MIIVRLLSPEPWLVSTTKAYSGVGADIVMESISLTTWVSRAKLHEESLGIIENCPRGRCLWSKHPVGCRGLFDHRAMLLTLWLREQAGSQTQTDDSLVHH